MGCSADARLVFGKALPGPDDEDRWLDEDGEEALYQELEGTPLTLHYAGHYEYTTPVIAMRNAGIWAYDYGIKTVPLDALHPDVREIVNSERLARHLGILDEGEGFKWLLVASYG